MQVLECFSVFSYALSLGFSAKKTRQRMRTSNARARTTRLTRTFVWRVLSSESPQKSDSRIRRLGFRQQKSVAKKLTGPKEICATGCSWQKVGTGKIYFKFLFYDMSCNITQQLIKKQINTQ